VAVLPLLTIEPLRRSGRARPETLAVTLTRALAGTAGAAAAAALISIPAALTGLTDGELGQRTLLWNAIRTRKRRANQGPAHGPFVARDAVVDGRRFGGRRRRLVGRHLRGGVGSRRRDSGVRLVAHSGQNLVVKRVRSVLATPTGRAPTFERMLGIARRASRLTNRVVNHRDDGVVGHPPLARTVIVDGITDTQPALLHETPGTDLW
jgi:hypothetical protein